MVDVKVTFEHNGLTWAHEFNVRRGSTIAKLKQQMLAPKGTPDDAKKFELRLKGRRVPDFVELKKPAAFEFEYLGQEEGERRAKEDAAREKEGDTYWESDEEEAKAWTVCFNYDLLGKGDVESMEATDVKAVKSRVEQFGYSGFSLWKGTAYMKKVGRQLTKKDLEFKGKDSGVTFYIYNPEPVYTFQEDKPKEQAQPQHQPEPPKPKASPAPAKPAEPPKPAATLVDVTVKHAMPEMESQLTVQVMSDCTVLDVRRAVMAALGESKLSEVKLVKRSGKTFTSVSGDEPLGARREFLSMGRSLAKKEAAAPPPAPEPPKPSQPAPAPAPAPPADEPRELDITVTIDHALGFTVPLKVMSSSTVGALKQTLAAMDPTGAAKAEDLFLAAPAKSAGQRPSLLSDHTLLTEEHAQLDLIPKELVGEMAEPPQQQPVVEAVRDVEVELAHALDGSSVKVTVPSDATILDVRRAAMAAIGQTKLSEVKIVKKSGGGIQSLGDSEKLNGRTSLKTMGCTLK
mmetsp:Transcript_53250/g.170599  ORF Transcript_53250/g.170599 Transcript_53250/m.170599 type:complete len:515 (+) Transcript_53250:55-1599(+)